MKSILRTVPLVSVFVLTFAGSMLYAQTGSGQGQGMGMRQRMPMYDPTTVITFKGTIEDVQQSTMQPGHMGGVNRMGHVGTHLVVKSDSGTDTVLVGPSSYVKDQGFEFSKGDQIEVTGSKVKYDDTDAVIAREIKMGGKVLTLRDEKGVPEWSMGRKP